jgi:hypothetical protein
MGNLRFSLIIGCIGLGAFLLFMLQPMAGKFLLPLLGGGPSVWNTAMVFFQIALLAGYALAHASGVLKLRTQILIPAVLLTIGAIISLPMAVPMDILGKPDVTKPILWQFGALALMVGLPFLALSMLSPLLQRWFSAAFPGRDPYALYRASNIGSFLGLLAYPLLAEPLLTLNDQSFVWTGVYGVLVLGLMLLAKALWAVPELKHEEDAGAQTPPDTYDTLLWLFLSFLPSALLLGVTAYITTDVASLPLFWILPLALYLLTFVFGFSAKLVPWRPILQVVQVSLFLALFWIIGSDAFISHGKLLSVHLALFFVNALVCHQLLFMTRPHPVHLTRFYLTTSLGGALGGVCVALIAPLVFPLPLEYPLAMALCVVTLLMRVKQGEHDTQQLPYERIAVAILLGALLLVIDDFGGNWGIQGRMAFRMAVTTLFVIMLASLYPYRRIMAIGLIAGFAVLPLYPWNYMFGVKTIERTYFGVLRVYDVGPVRNLTNGTTLHGQQMRVASGWGVPLTYYSTYSPFASVMAVLNARGGEQHIAGLGLGIGSIACYAQEGRHFTFFDIDPEVVNIAQNQNYFTYLSHCGSPYDIKLGDARLTLSGEPDRSYDLILVDVFSSDSIPVHMLTEEAVRMYMQKLKPNGFLLFHVSNRHFDLEPEVARIAKKLGLYAMSKRGEDGVIVDDIRAASTEYVAVAKDTDTLAALRMMASDWVSVADYAGKPWSDNYVNVIRALGRSRPQEPTD